MLGTLSDTIGRRPVLLLGASINCVVLLVAYCYLSGLWWVLDGGIMGSFDATWSICSAIVVDHVSHGAVAGGAEDNCFVRLAYRLISGARAAEEPLCHRARHFTPPPLRPVVFF